MKLRIAIVLVALIPVFFAMQNCGGSGGAGDLGSLGLPGGGGSNLTSGLQGACLTSSGATPTSCYEAYGLSSQVSLAQQNCASSQPSGSTNSFTALGHCNPAVFAFKCDTSQSNAGGRFGVITFFPAAAQSLQQSCTGGGGVWSATN